MMKITAIVPMRHNSERVKGKNYREFAGKPLYHYIVEALLTCDSISQVVIDTDSDWIIDDASTNFPDVICLKRPDHLTDGKIAMNDVLINTVRQIDSDLYLQTHSTNPLLSSESIENALSEFVSVYPQYDSLFSVTRLQTRLWNQLAEPINHNKNILLRTQDLPPVYEENSCIYVFSKSVLSSFYNRIGARPMMFEIDKAESIDIDEELDFELAEILYKKTKQ